MRKPASYTYTQAMRVNFELCGEREALRVMASERRSKLSEPMQFKLLETVHRMYKRRISRTVDKHGEKHVGLCSLPVQASTHNIKDIILSVA
jgi:hypothetical protein